MLDRVMRAGFGGYTRFLYWQAPPTCLMCSALLSDVIVPTDGGTSTPFHQAILLSNEVALEHHEFEVATDGHRPVAVASRGPGGAFGYEWDHVNHKAVRFDMHQPTGTCAGGCSTGSKCRQIDQTCYISTEVESDSSLLPTKQYPSGSSSSLGKRQCDGA